MILQFFHLIQTDSNYTIQDLFGKIYRVENVHASASIVITYGANNVTLDAGTYRDFWFNGADWSVSGITDTKIRTSAPASPTAGDIWCV